MTDELLLLAPLIAPLIAAAVGLIARRPTVQLIAGAVALLAVAGAGVALVKQTLEGGPVSAVIGADLPGSGIVLFAEPFGAALVAITGLTSLLVLAAIARSGSPLEFWGSPLMMVLIGAASLSFVTGDLFNLFVLVEVVLTASYALLVLRSGARGLRAATVYLVVNIAGTVMLLTGIAAVFARAGTVGFAELSEGPVSLPGAALIVVALTLKSGLVPFSGWLAVGYPAAGRPVMALFAGTLTTVGVAALYRVGLLAFNGEPVLRGAVLVAAIATLLLAPLAALAARRQVQVLALLIAAQVSFACVGFGIGTRAALAAGIFVLLQEVAVKTALVLSYAPDRERAASPLALGTFAVFVLSMAGIPPLVGFTAKAMLIGAAFDAGAAVTAAAMLLASLATIAALLPLWSQLRRGSRPGSFGVALVALAVIVAGVFPGGLLDVAEAAVAVLLEKPYLAMGASQ